MGGLIESLVDKSIEELFNRSSSAVLLLKVNTIFMAFAFGYGNSLLDLKYFVPDFGIKTALNMIQPNSLRSIDILSLGENAVQKKAQSARLANVNNFGVNVSKDILRGVTGTPRDKVDLKNISGRDYVFSFTIDSEVSKLTEVVSDLFKYYDNNDYKSDFSWVDNIRRVIDKEKISQLNDKLVMAVKMKSSEIVITLPEVMALDKISGFSFTRAKDKISSILETEDYYKTIVSLNDIDIQSLKSDRLFVFNLDGEVEQDYRVFNSIYFEYKDNNNSYVLFSNQWYEIDSSFIKRLNQRLEAIKISKLPFPEVMTWLVLATDKKRLKREIEAEGTYNERVSKDKKYYLLDKKLVKSNQTTSSIEVCDLLTEDGQFIHVKHKKGNSSGLSHLFAQGSVSAEVILGDKEFRKRARQKFRNDYPKIKEIIPLDKVDSRKIEIVFLVLGESSEYIIEKLPFFSKINLSNVHENLTQKGFNVSVAGASLAKFKFVSNVNYIMK